MAVEGEDLREGKPTPIVAGDVSDTDRAEMLQKYLSAFADEFGVMPKLMPLGKEGKKPAIEGRCRLDSPEARDLLASGPEAVRRIREDGGRGFCLYAGKPDHGTGEVVFVDHDDLSEFPTPTGEATLTVRSGGGGLHETYRNAGDVENARVGDDHGEIRAENWYVVVPGSIHPSGGVYHVEDDRPIATLADADLGPAMRPAAVANGGAAAATGTGSGGAVELPTPEYEPVEDGPDPEAVADVEPWLRDYLTDGADDRSRVDFAACVTLAEYGVAEADARALLDASHHTKVHERGSGYWRQTWANAVRRADVASKSLDGHGVGASGESERHRRAVPIGQDVPDSPTITLDAARNDCHAAIYGVGEP